MAGTITITTHRGTFQLEPDQVVGVEKVMLPQSDGTVIEGSQVLVSLGVILKPRPEVMRALADLLETANGRIVPVSRIIAPRAEG